MRNFGILFLWALAACVLQGSFAEDQSGYICLIEEPKQNQCDSYCLTELSPRLNEVVKAQNEGNTNTRESVNEMKSKLETLEVKIGKELAKLPQEVHAELEGRLQGVENKLEGRLQGLEGQLKEVQTKLEDSLIAVQKKIENQLQAVVNQLQLVQNKTDAVEVKSQLQAKSNTTAVPQQAVKAEVPASSTITIPSGFNLFGNRYFRIVYEYANWETAEKRCREMGGYLAAFRNEEEFHAIISNLANWSYWLGINDREIEGHFVSVASHKPAPFLKWREGKPSDKNNENCVFLSGGNMWDGSCNRSIFFICQADNET